MHSIAMLAVVSLASTLGTAIADEKAMPSPGLPPQFMTVGKIDLETKTLVLYLRTVHVVSPDDYKNETDVRKNLLEPVYETRTITVSFQSSAFTDAGGKKVDSADLSKRLEFGTAVVVSADGEAVDSVYLKALAKDTIVIVDRTLVHIGAKSAALFPPSIDYQAPHPRISR